MSPLDFLSPFLPFWYLLVYLTLKQIYELIRQKIIVLKNIWKSQKKTKAKISKFFVCTKAFVILKRLHFNTESFCVPLF